MRDPASAQMPAEVPVVEVLRTRSDSMAPNFAQASPTPVAGRPSGSMSSASVTTSRIPTTGPVPMRTSAQHLAMPAPPPINHKIGRGFSMVTTIAIIGITIVLAIVLYFMIRPH
jgi:hypothetical protein